MEQQTATEAAAEAAKLREDNQKLAQQLVNEKQRSQAATQEADARLQMHHSEVGAVLTLLVHGRDHMCTFVES